MTMETYKLCLKAVMAIVNMLCFVECTRVTYSEGDGVSESIIEQYVEVVRISPTFYPGNLGCISITVRPEQVGFPLSEGYDGFGYNDNTDVYTRLQREYDDCHFNKVRGVESGLKVAINNFVSIDITSDADFNGIPAGESLASKVRIVAKSPCRWLKHHVTFDWLNSAPQDFLSIDKNALYYFEELYPINMLVSEIRPSDLELLELKNVSFLFQENPEIKKHNFTVTFKEEYKEISAHVSAEFK